MSNSNACNVYLSVNPSPLYRFYVRSPLPLLARYIYIFRPSECVYACLRSRCAPPSAPPITFAASRGFARRAKGSNVRDNESRMRACLRACVHAGVHISALVLFYCRYSLKNNTLIIFVRIKTI